MGRLAATSHNGTAAAALLVPFTGCATTAPRAALFILPHLAQSAPLLPTIFFTPQVCYALSQLASGFFESRGTSPMSPDFKDVVQALLETVRASGVDGWEGAGMLKMWCRRCWRRCAALLGCWRGSCLWRAVARNELGRLVCHAAVLA